MDLAVLGSIGSVVDNFRKEQRVDIFRNRKARLAAGVTAAAFALAAASPAALAETEGNVVAFDDSVAVDNSRSVEYEAFSQNVIGSIETGDATVSGDATATATDGSVAVATVDAEADTSVEVVNSFDNDLDDDGVLDAFDWIILFGDFDNDGFVDWTETH